MLKLKVIEALLTKPETISPWIIGETLFIRTVTYHLTGQLIAEKNGFLILADAAWIADSGRFSDALRTGEPAEVEPVDGPVRVNITAIVDVFHWPHALPRKQI